MVRILRQLSTRAAALLLCALFRTDGFSQTLTDGDRTMHWEADALTGLNSEGWQFDIGAAYFPIPYVGLKASIGIAEEIEGLADLIRNSVCDYPDYDYYDTPYYTTRFKFNPAIVLRSPGILYWHSMDAAFHLFAEPGLVISPGARGSRNARICCWDIKTGINLQVDRFIAFIGYGITDFSLYSGHPRLKNNSITHSGFIGGTYKF